jgi:hypothetical protein
MGMSLVKVGLNACCRKYFVDFDKLLQIIVVPSSEKNGAS